MTRIVKNYDERCTEFLDAAQSLFFSKGYEQTSVQDIIKAVNVAKGTFYHYFDSKVDLLDAVIKRVRQQVLVRVEPIVSNTTINPVEKLEKFFNEVNNWKLNNHHIVLHMLRLLYKDANALLRLKMFEETLQALAQPLGEIIQHGVDADAFNVVYPAETASIILKLCEMPSSTLIAVLLEGGYNEDDVEAIKRELEVFNRSVERVLGITQSQFDLINADDLSEWLSLLEKLPVSQQVR